MPRTLAEIRDDVEAWIAGSTARFRSEFSDGREAWVLKFIDARFLGGFLSRKELAVSATPGFTWGDAVYVTPAANPFSTMMYGRAGIMGRLDVRKVRAYDAVSRTGIRLYQEWIQHSTRTFNVLTTTVHANLANRLLRNAFRARYRIDVVSFAPDQLNAAYVDRLRDRWFAVTDWTHSGVQLPGARPAFSAVVQDCEWVAIVGEQFEETPLKVHYNNLFGPNLRSGPLLRGATSATLLAALHTAHANARAGRPHVINVDP